jgi:uncharacterized membrane protein
MRRWVPAVFITAGVVFSIAVYSRLPAIMATHWDARGRPNGFSTRPFAAFLLPLLAVGLWLVMRVIPHIDPRRANIEKFRDTFDLLIITMIGMLMVLHVAMLGAAIGWPVSLSRLTPILVGALFVALGNLMPRFRSNFFLGIRTPWTLSSEQVWMKTHRVGGYLMVVAGLFLIASAFFQSMTFSYLAFAALLGVALATVIYSYVIWRAEGRRT